MGAATVKMLVPKFALNPGVFESTILKYLARSAQLNIFRNKSSYSRKTAMKNIEVTALDETIVMTLFIDVKTIVRLSL